ncbi:MAG: hypothetical protein HY596_04230 [Candidatus Omnitrophica bacterium]|nr:hypothetical protein [Candidatus Omnitrophota bacterium]
MGSAKKGKETPAEQLLRMIEGPAGAANVPHASASPSLRQLWAGLQELPGRLLSRLRPARRETDAFLWNLTMAQRLLWGVLLALGAYVAFDLVVVQPRPKLGRRVATATVEPATESPGASGSPASALKPLAEYLAVVQQASPFGGAASIIAAPAAQSTKQRLAELAQGLVVVGIDRSANPEAIIEDTTQKRTYFIKVGDELNGMAVKDISVKGVIVSYEGEELLVK